MSAHIKPISFLKTEKKGNLETSAARYNSAQGGNLKATLTLTVNKTQILKSIITMFLFIDSSFNKASSISNYKASNSKMSNFLADYLTTPL
jgi:hypothetical protein